MISRIKKILIGVPLNPFHPNARNNVALIALFAWVGLGADALSSSCYGPEEAYVALGTNTPLALFVAAITVVTIFIISLGYNQVMELFPGGGGGYKVASKLLHPYAGLIAGAALMVDYVLTIAVSIASGTDALFSLLPFSFLHYKLYVETAFIVCLLVLNLRGMKETIKILLPIFLGFLITHVAILVYGIGSHSQGIRGLLPQTMMKTQELAASFGWLTVIGLTLHSYSLGSGTYTGLEAISNNVQHLKEPRVQTGKRTMLYMAISLSVAAGGLLLLYMLWNVQPVPGQTMNATVFHAILGNSVWGTTSLTFMLLLEAGLLFVAANSGFMAGPSVLANMAIDQWVPNRFRHLSNRLVVQNGLMLFGVAALIMIYLTAGKVSTLVVLYSINVFITFSLSLLGISVYWVKHRTTNTWQWHFLLSAFAFMITTLILGITLYYKFRAGGWLTLIITTAIVAMCITVKRHYQHVAMKLTELDKLLEMPVSEKDNTPHALNPQLPTAILFVNQLCVGMHTLLSILRLFPGQFKNFVFIGAGTVDTANFGGADELTKMQAEMTHVLDYFVRYCRQYQIPADSYAAFGTDPVEELKRLADEVGSKYPHAVFFSSQLVFRDENALTRTLHNQTPLLLQHYLHFRGKELMILPMKL